MIIISSGECINLFKKHNIGTCSMDSHEPVQLLNKKNATVEELIACKKYEPGSSPCKIVDDYEILPIDVISIEDIVNDSSNYALKLCMGIFTKYDAKPCMYSNQETIKTLVGEVQVSVGDPGASDGPVTLMGEVEADTEM